MSTLQTLKTFIHQRLAVAVEEISALLETTVSNYEEEITRQRRLLEDERSEFLINKAGERSLWLRCSQISHLSACCL